MRNSALQLVFVLPIVGAFAACSGGDGDTSTPSLWAGKTFLLDVPALSNSKWVRPKGFGADIGRYVPQFLIGVEAGAAADSLKFTLTTAQEGQQDMCNQTTEVEVAGVQEPDITISVGDFPMHIISQDSEHPGDEHTTGRNVIFTNILPGNEDPTTSQLDATLDVAELYPFFWQIQDASKETVCETFDYNGVPCEACPQNSEPYCLSVRAVQLPPATEVATSIQKLSASEAAANCP
jgi:hypothetical protein